MVHVEGVEHARRLAAAAIYRLLKGLALERVLREGVWPGEKSRRYILEDRCQNADFVPMIESPADIENLEAICGIPGVNASVVGPNDLTTAMGIPNEYDHPDLIAILKRIIDVADRSHIPAGCWFGKPEQMQRTIGQGSEFVVYSNDGAFLRELIQTAFFGITEQIEIEQCKHADVPDRLRRLLKVPIGDVFVSLRIPRCAEPFRECLRLHSYAN